MSDDLAKVLVELDEIAAELATITGELTIVECCTILKTPTWERIEQAVKLVNSTKAGLHG